MVRSRAEQGVDFLGYRICPKGITVAEATITRGVTRPHRLDEQQGRDPQQTVALGGGGSTRPAALLDAAAAHHSPLEWRAQD